MSYCPKCGTEVQENAKFCKNCGNKVETLTNPPVAETIAVERVEKDKNDGLFESVISVAMTDEAQAEKEKLIQRKMEVGKEVFEKYEETAKFFSFRANHPQLFGFLKGLVFGIPALFLGMLYYFIFGFNGKFSFIGFAVYTVLAGLMGMTCSEVLGYIYEMASLFYTFSWLKKNTYGDGKKCDTFFVCSSVLLYGEKGLLLLPKGEVLKGAIRISSFLREIKALNSSKIRTVVIVRLVWQILLALLKIIPYVGLYTVIVPMASFLIKYLVFHTISYNVSPWIGLPFGVIIVFFIVVSIVDSIVSRICLKKQKKYEEELAEVCKNAQEE